MSKAAVLLMAYGAAASLEEIPAYLADIRGGRPVDAKLIEEVRQRYRCMGGASPLLEITARQARGLQAALDAARPGAAKVFTGMRHSSPRIVAAVKEIVSQGLRTVVPVPLTPYHSAMSTGAYLKRYTAAVRDCGVELESRPVIGWAKQPRLIRGLARKLRDALGRLSRAERARAVVLFTAHSLPRKVTEMGDPYPDQLKACAQAVAAAAEISSWRFAYQSRGRTGEEWLGPDAAEELARAKAEEASAVVLSPIGFISDHMETLYDDDILYKGQAETLGLRFERAGVLNDDPDLIGALAAAVLEKL